MARQFPALSRLLSRFIRDETADLSQPFMYTTLVLNKNPEMPFHRDTCNLGPRFVRVLKVGGKGEAWDIIRTTTRTGILRRP